jgi:predicted MFS family arabinose efflux permease
MAVLTVVSFFNYFDRMALSVLLSQIKIDLRLSDAQLGLLTGLAFALFYAAMAVPIARLADRKGKAAVLSGCVAIWSVATAMSGAATSFAMLFTTRTFVGIGEAGCVPASLALIAERFAPARRPFAISVFQSGLLIGSAVGLVAAGWLGQALGWRVTLALIGIAGLPVALLVAIILRNVSTPATAVEPQVPRPNALADIKILCSRHAFLHAVAGLSLASFGTYSILQWFPTHLVRSFRMPLGEAGAVLGSAVGIGGVIGILIGGVITGRLVSRDRRWDLWLPSLIYLIVAPVYCLAIGVNDPHLAGQMTFAGVAIMFLANGAGLSAIQRFSEPERRATANAILLVLSAVFGVGLGPVVVGAISDYLQPQHDPASSLRLALMISTASFLWSSVHFFFAARFDREKDMVVG